MHCVKGQPSGRKEARGQGQIQEPHEEGTFLARGTNERLVILTQMLINEDESLKIIQKIPTGRS